MKRTACLVLVVMSTGLVTALTAGPAGAAEAAFCTDPANVYTAGGAVTLQQKNADFSPTEIFSSLRAISDGAPPDVRKAIGQMQKFWKESLKLKKNPKALKKLLLSGKYTASFQTFNQYVADSCPNLLAQLSQDSGSSGSGSSGSSSTDSSGSTDGD
ncbi:MAG: hypothetical protein ACKOA9_05120 [Actinomycetota bacterium]